MADGMTIEDIEQVELTGTLDKSSGDSSDKSSDSGSDNASSKGGASNSKTIGDEIWTFLTTADKWFNVNMYETLHNKKSFELEDINFLPQYVKKHIANDFYTKMFSQLYPDPPTASTNSSNGSLLDKITGAVSNAAGSAVSKVTNTVANQITATSNYARNLVSTLTFGLIDMSQSATSGKNCSYSMIQTAIPHLKVTEIRLNDKLSQKGILFTCMGKMFKAGSDLAQGNEGMKDIGTKISKGFEKGLDAICDATIHMSASDWLSKMSSGNMKDVMATRIGGMAYSFIRNSASGKFMNTYKLPHFGNPTMLKSIGVGGFEHSSCSGDLLNIVNEMTGGSLTLMENISWSATRAGKMAMEPFTGTFYLFNDTLQMYMNNLDFIIRAVTHSMPIRDSFMYRAPCCYDVTDVGNRRCYFCSGEFTVKKIGKIRKLSASPSLSSLGGATTLIKSIKSGIMDAKDISSSEINDDIIDYIPDAFEISYTFTPLISENYNTFVYYFLEQGGNPSQSVLPAYTSTDSKTNEKTTSRDTTSTEYGSNIDYLSDKLMKKFVDAFTGALG